MVAILKAMEKLEIPFGDPDRRVSWLLVLVEVSVHVFTFLFE